jgi:hypothetical protein
MVFLKEDLENFIVKLEGQSDFRHERIAGRVKGFSDELKSKP